MGLRIIYFLIPILLVNLTSVIATALPLEGSEQKLTQLASGLSSHVAKLSLKALSYALSEGKGGEERNLAIIDYSLPSTEKRFWLFDLNSNKLIIEDYVAHGKNSGESSTVSFSNEVASLKSSLGLFRIGDPYTGMHGGSLRLFGLEEGFNHNAYERNIVIHGASYVSSDFIQSHSRLGRSFGCPALSINGAKQLLSYFKNRTGYLFSYYPDKNWLNSSKFLNN